MTNKATSSSLNKISSQWPFLEAAKLAKRVENRPEDEPILFETGYGPSGVPHIGTFGEVLRTIWVRLAFERLTGRKTRLLAFSDDMDALRKVPTNVPQQEMLAKYIGQPLSKVPDPFGTHESFAAHNNARLCTFLDQFGFDYEFASATQYYTSGYFDKALKRVLEEFPKIMKVVLPTLRDARKATYAPILPLHPRTGEVMQVPVEVIDSETGMIRWSDYEGEEFETCVFGGGAKMQWKGDWAMRWYALGVDYEMAGKDLTDSVKLSSKICRILGGVPPVNLIYELFLDAEGQKISKSKGNGLSLEEWLSLGPEESLAQFMFHQPQRAKRLHKGIIGRSIDDYLSGMERLQTSDKAPEEHIAWFLHKGNLPEWEGAPVSFSLLLNLATALGAKDEETLWKFLRRYDPNLSAETQPFLAKLLSYVLEHVREQEDSGARKCREPEEKERLAIEELRDSLVALNLEEAEKSTAEVVQNLTYSVGKKYFGQEGLRTWFSCLYEVLLGRSEGPRFGVFVALYGLPEVVALINQVLNPDGKSCETVQKA
ncbi:lysine--tRNA ligase [Acetobacteraceae bacterium]|nr:lysine--tRNA ligase [Acetobacteraceae bacterium]